MARSGLAHRLYRGETTFPLIKRKRIFYLTSLMLVSICLISMATLKFNLGVEFKGGATFQWPSQGASVEQARELFDELGQEDAIVQTIGRGSDADLRVQTPPLTEREIDAVVDGIQERFPGAQVSPSNVGPAWGDRVTTKAVQGLGLFLVAVIVYISIRFEPKMAVAAIVALIHDLILTAGVYSLTQFVVTPSTIIALLTVLGYSLYDTIVVFDKVEENTKGLAGSNKSTYSEAVELAANQTFMRSVNTSLIALLPVSGLLFVGAFLLGAGTLKDLALALFVGLASGAYSSLFLASPVLADLKEREPQYKALAQRVLARRSGTEVLSPRAAREAALAGGTATLTSALTPARTPDLARGAVDAPAEAAAPAPRTGGSARLGGLPAAVLNDEEPGSGSTRIGATTGDLALDDEADADGAAQPGAVQPGAGRRPGGSANRRRGQPGRPGSKQRR